MRFETELCGLGLDLLARLLAPWFYLVIASPRFPQWAVMMPSARVFVAFPIYRCVGW